MIKPKTVHRLLSEREMSVKRSGTQSKLKISLEEALRDASMYTLEGGLPPSITLILMQNFGIFIKKGKHLTKFVYIATAARLREKISKQEVKDAIEEILLTMSD